MYRYRTIGLAGAAEQPRIITSDGAFEYTLTQEDLEWFYRAIAGEVGQGDTEEGRRVIWTLVQNFVARSMPGGPQRFGDGSLLDFVEGYAQAINPVWMDPGGRRCQQDLRRHEAAIARGARSSWACAPDRIRRREANRARSFSSRPELWNLMQAWSRGEVTNPVDRATEYAQPRVVCYCGNRANTDPTKCIRILYDHCPSDIPRKPGSCSTIPTVNCHQYASWEVSEKWPPNYVRVGFPGREVGTGEAMLGNVKVKTIGLALGVGLLGIGGVYAYRNYR